MSATEQDCSLFTLRDNTHVRNVAIPIAQLQLASR